MNSLKRSLSPVFFAALVVCLGFWLFPGLCHANPINPDFPIKGNFGITLSLWIICPLIEAGVIVLLLRRSFSGIRPMLVAFGLIVALNLVTIFITQIIAGDLLQSSVHNSVYLAELFPLVSEYLVMLLLLSILYRRGALLTGFNPEHTFAIVFGVNLLTFLIGLAFYHYWPAPYNPLPLVL